MFVFDAGYDPIGIDRRHPHRATTTPRRHHEDRRLIPAGSNCKLSGRGSPARWTTPHPPPGGTTSPTRPPTRRRLRNTPHHGRCMYAVAGAVRRHQVRRLLVGAPAHRGPPHHPVTGSHRETEPERGNFMINRKLVLAVAATATVGFTTATANANDDTTRRLRRARPSGGAAYRDARRRLPGAQGRRGRDPGRLHRPPRHRHRQGRRPHVQPVRLRGHEARPRSASASRPTTSRRRPRRTTPRTSPRPSRVIPT